MIMNFETNQGKFAFVKLPDLAYAITIDALFPSSQINYTVGKFNTIGSRKSVTVNKKLDTILGFVKDLTEENWKNVVDNISDYDMSEKEYVVYLDYLTKKTVNNALDSAKSLLDSLQVYLINPVPNPNKQFEKRTDNTIAYQNAEERTGNWLLIKFQ